MGACRCLGVEAEVPGLGRCVHAGDRTPEGECFVLVVAEALGDDHGPERHHGSAIDLDRVRAVHENAPIVAVECQPRR